MSRYSPYAFIVIIILTGCRSFQQPLDPLQELKVSADAGEVQSQLLLGRVHETGEGVPVDIEESLYWYVTAAGKGSAEAAYAAARLLRPEGSARQAQMMNLLRQAVRAEHAPSMIMLGDLIMENHPDTVLAVNEAVHLYSVAAERGYPEAQFKLADWIGSRTGKSRDMATAVRWYKRAAGQGHADAQLALGNAYLNGIGVQANVAAALKWYERSARQGRILAQSHLGDLLTFARYDSIRDPEAGAQWYRLSAEQGHAHAQERLAMLYEDGDGVIRDAGAAAQWYLAAAEQGNARAQCHLGSLYLRGQGVRQSDSEANRWFNLAAAQVPAGVLSLLGFIYYDCDQFDSHSVRLEAME